MIKKTDFFNTLRVKMEDFGIDLSTEIADIYLPAPIWNASGVLCTQASELQSVLDSPYTGAVTTKSCTPFPRQGNPSPRYSCDTNELSINSMGLPNNGLQYYIDAPRTLELRHKPYFISICGLTTMDNMQMLSVLEHDELTAESSIAGVELNLSCPNVIGKPQTGYDFERMDEVLRQTFEMFDRLPLGVKLPPYFDPVHFDMAAAVLKRYPIRWVTCINSVGNGLVIDPISECTVIHPKQGLGGIGGGSIKATALANVWSFRQRLPASIDIIGCGGVRRGIDVFEHILCGANAVQIGTTLSHQGVNAFYDITFDLLKVMKLKGYKTLGDFRGTLKTAEPISQ